MGVLSNFTSATAKRRIDRCLKDDLLWWKETLPVINGVAFFDDTHRRTIYLFTDACLTRIGGFFYENGSNNWRENIARIDQNNAFSTRIPPHAANEKINFLELLAIFYAFSAWSARLRRCYLIVNTDNTTAFQGLQSLRLRGASNKPLRDCLRLAASADITLKPVWLSSKTNALADALSRHDNIAIANICAHWQPLFFST